MIIGSFIMAFFRLQLDMGLSSHADKQGFAGRLEIRQAAYKDLLQGRSRVAEAVPRAGLGHHQHGVQPVDEALVIVRHRAAGQIVGLPGVGLGPELER